MKSLFKLTFNKLNDKITVYFPERLERNLIYSYQEK